MQPALVVIGDAYGQAGPVNAAEMLLRWGIAWLRPDRAPVLHVTDRQAWLERASWRPFIALVCHFGLVAIPDFPDHYYRRRGEPPVETLCGLWGIGPSTFYRCIDTAKRRLGQALAEQERDGRHTQAILEWTQAEVYRTLGLDEPALRCAWHARQTRAFTKAGGWLAAIWHWRAAGDFEAVHQLITVHLADVAGETGLDAELEALQADPRASQRDQVHIQLAIAAVHRVRNAPERELEAYTRALRMAGAPEDPAGLGVVYSHLGKYYEPRDADRAFASYQDSIDFLGRGDPSSQPPEVRHAYLETLIKLAWLYTLRNDPRAKGLLDRAETMAPSASAGDAALLQQAWGEYWRRTGDFEKALEHKHRALNLYERLGDTEGVLKTYINLGVIYDDLKRYDQALGYYRRVLDLAQTTHVDPEHIASTYLNLGACHYWLKDYAAAIEAYRRALDASVAAGLQLHAGRAHYNLAEAHYTRYLETHDHDDEQNGDAHVAAAIAAWEPENFPVYVESARALKTELLGGTKEHAEHRILPQEKAAHYPEMAEIEKQRAILDSDASPADKIRAHLSIAQAYMAISAQERDAALRLSEKSGQAAEIAPQLDGLKQAFEQSLADEDRIAKQWREATRLDDAPLRRAAQRLLKEGHLTKSAYAEACRVSPATASKHLVRLAQAGLLKQVGKGAGTRYVTASPSATEPPRG